MRKTNPVPIGDRRRMSDGKNAWRKMTQAQRLEFLFWLQHEEPHGLIEEILYQPGIDQPYAEVS